MNLLMRTKRRIDTKKSLKVQNWTYTDRNRQTRSETDRNRQKWTKMDRGWTEQKETFVKNSKGGDT